MTQATTPHRDPLARDAEMPTNPAASSSAESSVHRLDDAPLRTKAAMLVIAALMAGTGIGLLESHLAGAVIYGRGVPSLLIMLLGLVLLGSALIMLAQWWIASPYDRLVTQLDTVSRSRTPDDLGTLPLSRRDEAGQIARAMRHVTAVAIRDDREARQLRRTLDQRVTQATRKATAKLQRQALRDPMTDLGNRRFLDQQLDEIVDAAIQSGTQLSAIAIDLDGFKQLNDTAGHDAGDEILMLIAGLLKSCTRPDDLTVRLGGDEFVVLMPGCDRQRAVHLADLIAAHFRQQTRAARPAGPHTGLSAGVAEIGADQCKDGSALLKLADERLYEAKRSGKGRTCAG